MNQLVHNPWHLFVLPFMHFDFECFAVTYSSPLIINNFRHEAIGHSYILKFEIELPAFKRTTNCLEEKNVDTYEPSAAGSTVSHHGIGLAGSHLAVCHNLQKDFTTLSEDNYEEDLFQKHRKCLEY